MFSFVFCCFYAVTAVTKRLQILQSERLSAFVDRDNVVDHLGRGKPSLSLALLTERVLLELDSSQLPPLPGLIEFGIVVPISLEGFVFRYPWPLCMFLYRRHSEINILLGCMVCTFVFDIRDS